MFLVKKRPYVKTGGTVFFRRFDSLWYFCDNDIEAVGGRISSWEFCQNYSLGKSCFFVQCQLMENFHNHPLISQKKTKKFWWKIWVSRFLRLDTTPQIYPDKFYQRQKSTCGKFWVFLSFKIDKYTLLQ